jgi:hypothetical protein
MIILSTSTNSQNFVFIPRSNVFDYVAITDDQTGKTVEITNYTYTQGDYFDTFAAEFNLVENHFYDLLIVNGAVVVYKDRIFCTNQSVNSFSVNNGQYVSNSTTNEFIVYE